MDGGRARATCVLQDLRHVSVAALAEVKRSAVVGPQDVAPPAPEGIDFDLQLLVHIRDA
jgi:hypothetical protein